MYISQLKPIGYEDIERLYPGAGVQIDLPALYAAYVQAGLAQRPDSRPGHARVTLDSGFVLEETYNNTGSYYLDNVFHLRDQYDEYNIFTVDGAFVESYGCAPCRLEQVIDDGEYQQVFLTGLLERSKSLIGSSAPGTFSLTFADLIACGYYIPDGFNVTGIGEAVPY